MKIRINGNDFEGFTSAQTSRSFLDVCGHFQFETSILGDNNDSYPLKVQQSCEIIVGTQTVLTGFIENLQIHCSSNSTTITVSGRDKLCDLVDSTIDSAFVGEFNSAITLSSLCRKALDSIGLSDIDVIDKINPPKLTKGDYRIPFTGQSAFDFLQKYAKLRQVLLTTDGLGNLVIDRGVTADGVASILPTKIINKLRNNNNNVISSSYYRSTQQEFNLYRDYSQLAAQSADLSAPLGANSVISDYVSKQAGDATNSSIRSGRQLVFINDIPIPQESAKKRALWESNYRRSQGESYVVQVSEHTYDGTNVWPVNSLVQVFDDRAYLNGTNMILDTVTFKESIDEGRISELKLINDLSYSLQEDKDYRKALSDTGGVLFISDSSNA